MQRSGLRFACWVAAVAAVAAVLLVPMRAQDNVAPSATEHRVRISGGVMAGMLMHKGVPVYPVEAKRARVSGSVLMHVFVSKEGKVESVEAISGPDLLKDSALEAVRQWEYKPYLLNGEPVAVDTTVTVNYQMTEDPLTGAEREAAPGAPQAVTVPVKIVGGDGADKPVRIAGGVMAGRIISTKIPVYPPEAKAAHIGGTVILRAIISKDGTIRNIEVVSGPDILKKGAIDAVKQWRYQPYLLNGEPTEVDTTIRVNFHLSDDSKPRPTAEPAAAPPS